MGEPWRGRINRGGYYCACDGSLPGGKNSKTMDDVVEADGPFAKSSFHPNYSMPDGNMVGAEMSPYPPITAPSSQLSAHKNFHFIPDQ